MKNLRVAVGQFPVTSSPEFNMSYMKKQIGKASSSRADVIHFPETALTGYKTVTGAESWSKIYSLHEELCELALESGIFIVVGTQMESGITDKPFNATMIISNEGEVLGRYNKSKLYGKESDRFSSLDNHLVVDIHGVKCGFLICYDSCFINLFSRYKNLGVEMLFLSYYNAGNQEGENSLDDLTLAQIRTRAADFGFYISGSNSSKPHSRIASGIAAPDGSYEGLEKHEIGVHICDLPREDMGWTHHQDSWGEKSLDFDV